jgi:hypothetical protein
VLIYCSDYTCSYWPQLYATGGPTMSSRDRERMLVAAPGGPTMFARIGVMRALNRRVERVLIPDRKDHHWGRRKLAREHSRESRPWPKLELCRS